MAIFKCKMCGGELEINENQTVATCEYCGTQQTLPKLDDDRRANLYDRANHFRRNNDFDKAEGIYERILTEDNSDAEAYWSLVLCHYGIEYVEDPATHKRVPTVNRAQYTSIFDDENYKSALQYADSYQRGIYEAEAKAINEIQKGILAISQQEEPFDVFICYKETDNNGRRTPDSVLANDLYHQLTQEGFKVFFSRITLEDKLGSAYEPYIFAALNSAKVMVVLGTKPEYFNAVWVKNEWSRYLALIRQGQKKMLIPAYRDMDPYDLPEEFSHLQAQDMSKLGFMQDLIRGIKKIAQADEAKPNVVKEMAAADETTSTAPLLKRAFMFLEDGDWKSADEYCERVLDIDPENARAYLGKLMAELRVRKQEQLREQSKPFVDDKNYQKARRFADNALRTEIVSYAEQTLEQEERRNIDALVRERKDRNRNAQGETLTLEPDRSHIQEMIRKYSIPEYVEKAAIHKLYSFDLSYHSDVAERQQQYRNEEGYWTYHKYFSVVVNSYVGAGAEYLAREKKALFAELNDRVKKAEAAEAAAIRDVQERYAQHLKQADAQAEALYQDGVKRREADYQSFLQTAKTSCDVEELTAMAGNFEVLGDYQDSKDLAEYCRKRAAEQQTKLDTEAERQRVEKERAEKAQAAKNKKIGILSGIATVIVLAVAVVVTRVVIPDGKYNDAVALMDAGSIVEAYEAFVALGDYKDSVDKANSIYSQWNTVEKLGVAKVGDYVFFGSYEQDNNISNGKEEIEWLVLEKSDNKLLVISKYALDYQQYHTLYRNITWHSCSLRNWLNNDFINSAFSVDEKAMIPTVTVSADKNPEYDTDPGNETHDQVFLLSITEATKYFSSARARQCKPTEYTIAKGANIDSGTGCCNWWLRSPGKDRDVAAEVWSSGNVSESGAWVNLCRAVRPALWIDLGE